MTCVSLFITDNCCTNTRHTQLISSSLLMKNCSRLHHQSICRMTELSTDYDQEARRCCWPPSPQTTHIQQQRYGQQDNAPAHRAREIIELLWNETPDFIRPDLWPSNSPDPNPVDHKVWGVMQEGVYQKPMRNVEEMKQRPIAAWSGIQQSVIDQAIDQWRERFNACCVSKLKANTLNNYFDVLIHNCELSGRLMLALLTDTCCVSQGSAMTFIRGGGYFDIDLLQIHSDICVPKIIKIERYLTKLLRK